MRCAPSGATSTVSTAPGEGDRWSPPPEEVPPDRNLPWRVIRSENHTQPSQNGATRRRWTPFRCTLSRIPGSRAIGGKGYRRSLSHVFTIASSPSGAGWVRENQSRQCAVSWDAKRSTSAWLNILQIWNLHSLDLSPCLDRMSAPWLRCPGMLTAPSERSFPWAHRRIWCASLYRGRDRRPSWWLIFETTDVLSVRTSTLWPLRSGRKCFRKKKKTASISRQLMSHVRWWPLHRPWAERPLMTDPQLVREASVVRVSPLYWTDFTRDSERGHAGAFPKCSDTALVPVQWLKQCCIYTSVPNRKTHTEKCHVSLHP